MSESIIADFVATFNSEASARAEPVKGRILLSEKRLVLAADEGKVTIPLSAIFDVAVGQVPDDLGDFFNSTVTVAFEKGGNRMVAAVEADDDKIEKFTTVLFKAVLNGTDVTVKHPARVGGRVTGESFAPAKLFLKPGTVRFRRSDDAVDVDLSTVSNFERTSREINGADRAVLAVRHLNEGQAALSLAAMDSPRKMSILGRYLRLEYSDLMADLEDVTLSEEQVELLVAVYSTGPGVSLANVLDAESSQLTMVLNDLRSDELVVDGEDGPTLTPKGRVVVSNHLEDVNA
ncbi:CheF family chemotaxis protein [Halosimplex litoreum]|uniref:Taxis protein CheF n=1 Tax=Halosimplex litoreum TaxID=1198301 RepID=A0A7T3FWH3_9EURY|nr:CheF family chemotaxis protein [Halosimplex litoreum]QPV61968.1 CheF family chemotaxis protein [Halosimplex litoreum]